MKISDQVLSDFKWHALKCYPNEAAGVIVNDVYVPCENVASDPKKDFRIASTELLKIEHELGKIQAVLHTHPYDPFKRVRFPEWPTHADMVSWIADPIPWGIAACDGQAISPLIWLDDEDRPPLLGRQFAWGVRDCYALVRDYYFFERKVSLPNYPRAFGWEARGENLIMNNFEKVGFETIKKADAKRGDVLIYKYRSGVPNHCAVITGPNLSIHQLAYRESAYQRLSDWWHCESFVLRYVA